MLKFILSQIYDFFLDVSVNVNEMNYLSNRREE